MEHYLFAACMLIVVGAALYIQARQYDHIIKRLDQFQQLGVKVSMDAPSEKPSVKGLSLVEKRVLLEKLARAKAAEDRRKAQESK